MMTLEDKDNLFAAFDIVKWEAEPYLEGAISFFNSQHQSVARGKYRRILAFHAPEDITLVPGIAAAAVISGMPDKLNGDEARAVHFASVIADRLQLDLLVKVDNDYLGVTEFTVVQ
ncbi:hypothetical protein QNI19_08345 [Cytophagaceae bacterium DM2B3-1]|uniref:Uncharacterized protein n=1 Tax=Xanthocytophaga flava TaxID=3048013 RepID=A0ABT7CGW7_9BACT|nr:hypothetical protein [Xanthocytophaga flavus]MDJ1471077.1 hypothetical protein [Xanthocytophaga flavus]MDJ1492938.1 hypothetical protein [Xanthocytophaga flavus]